MIETTEQLNQLTNQDASPYYYYTIQGSHLIVEYWIYLKQIRSMLRHKYSFTGDFDYLKDMLPKIRQELVQLVNV